jgi:hypothetical protein
VEEVCDSALPDAPPAAIDLVTPDRVYTLAADSEDEKVRRRLHPAWLGGMGRQGLHGSSSKEKSMTVTTWTTPVSCCR